MKKLFWLMFLAMPFSIRSQTVSEDGGIKWTTGLTWEEVKEKAQRENKFIFIDAYATWCGPCKKMDNEVYVDKNVGEILNPQFVSVRLQMDQSSVDNEVIRNWYPIVKEFSRQYSIDGYPSFLFFNARGKLVHKAAGYLKVSEFVELAKDALTDPEKRFEDLIEKYKKGELNYTLMPDLAIEAYQNKSNRDLGVQILKTYKTEYLDKLPDDEVFKMKDLIILARYCGYLINSKDRYFRFFYNEPEIADSIMNEKLSRQATFLIIRQEELYDKIYKDRKPITFQKPKWDNYKRSIKNKYGEKYVDKMFPNEQIDFYQRANDWKNYVKYVNEKIKKTPPQVRGKSIGFGGMFADAWHVNKYAWDLFLYCNDKKYLNKALSWANLAIKLDTTSYNDDYYDTKANLLYKMGKTNDAIQLEQIAVGRSNNSDKAVADNLRKMKAGLPTWDSK